MTNHLQPQRRQIHVVAVGVREKLQRLLRRVALCRLLLQQPDILLLDEPTNYLDKEHIEWLKRYLNDYENAFILISHDIHDTCNVHFCVDKNHSIFGDSGYK